MLSPPREDLHEIYTSRRCLALKIDYTQLHRIQDGACLVCDLTGSLLFQWCQTFTILTCRSRCLQMRSSQILGLPLSWQDDLAWLAPTGSMLTSCILCQACCCCAYCMQPSAQNSPHHGVVIEFVGCDEQAGRYSILRWWGRMEQAFCG